VVYGWFFCTNKPLIKYNTILKSTALLSQSMAKMSLFANSINIYLLIKMRMFQVGYIKIWLLWQHTFQDGYFLVNFTAVELTSAEMIKCSCPTTQISQTLKSHILLSSGSRWLVVLLLWSV